MEAIKVERFDGIARVTLNRPQVKNAVTFDMWRELAGIFSRLAEDRDVRGIVLKGAGANFSVGADISEFATIRDDKSKSAEYEVAVDACSGAIAAVAHRQGLGLLAQRV